MSDAQQRPEEPEAPNDEEVQGAVGKRTNSKLGRKLVMGNGEYIDDIYRPGMLHARFVRSQHAHARIVDVDASEALAMDGVELVWTAEDLQEYAEPFGVHTPDEEALASERVRFVGDEIAVVLATDRRTAVEAANKVDIEYETIDAVVKVEEATANDAPILHPDLAADPDTEIEGNVYREFTLTSGDVEQCFEEADLVVEGSFETQKTNPSPLEPRGCIAEYNHSDHELTLHSPNQMPHLLGPELAEAIPALEPEDIVVKVPDIGGGFGLKLELFSHEVCATALSMETKRPVKFVLDRLEEMKTGRGRCAEAFDARMAFSADGTMTGIDIDMVQNTGAHATFGIDIAHSPSVMAAGPYLVEHQRTHGRVVYTNVMPGSAVRGYGEPQYAFMREQLIDEAAAELDIDPLEVRLQNIPKKENMPVETPTGIRLRNVDLPKCLRSVKDMINWDDHRGGYRTHEGKLRGIGFGMFIRRNGNMNSLGADYAGALVKMDPNGLVRVFTGIASIGQGTETGISQIVADTLGISVDRVKPVVGDTDTTPEDMGVWADRGTMFAGTAAALAAQELREKLDRLAASILKIDEDDLVVQDGEMFERGNPENGLNVDELANLATYGDQEDRPDDMKGGVSLFGHAKFETQEAEKFSRDEVGNMSHTYTLGCVATLVEIDPGTGDTEVIDAAAAEDLGNVINPKLVEGQIQGCIGHAVGDALLERMDYSATGTLLNGNLVDYHLPTIADVPMVNKIEEVESPDPTTPYGQRGCGEGALVPVPAAVANAIADATGIRFNELPISPDRLLPALIEHDLREFE